MQTSELEEGWKMINDALNWYLINLQYDEIDQLADRLTAKAEWIRGLRKR